MTWDQMLGAGRGITVFLREVFAQLLAIALLHLYVLMGMLSVTMDQMEAAG